MAASVMLMDPWIKAADSGTTTVFGMLHNQGTTAVTLVGATGDFAGGFRLHETVTDPGGAATMRQKSGGFAVPPGSMLDLTPSGDHLMAVGLTRALVAGDEVDVTLEFANGSRLTATALVKDFAGADETYADT